MSDPTTQGYLIDWYAVLGIEPTATQAEIKEAYRAHARDYHPDRYAHLAKDLATQAAERFRLANEANAALSDPKRREAYDAERAAWTGPVSTSGMPVIELGSRRFDPTRLFDREDADRWHAMIDKHAAQMAPHDENTLSIMATLARQHPDDGTIAAAHRDLLRKKDLHLALRESLLWETAGERNRPIDDAPREYLAAIADSIEKLSLVAKTACSAYSLRLAGGEPSPLLPADGTAATDDGHAADEAYQPTSIVVAARYDEALSRFEDVAKRIRTIAEERQKVIEGRFTAIATKYADGSPTDGLRLLLRLTLKDRVLWMAFCIQGTTIAQIASPVVGGLDQDPTPETLAEAIADGCSILHAEFEEGLKLIDQIHEVVLRHFTQHIPDEDPPEPPEKN